MATAEELYQGLVDSMQDLSDVRPNFKAILYGDSGPGKTVLALKIAQEITAPNKVIAYVDFSEGWVVLRNKQWEHLIKRVKRFQYQGLSQLEMLSLAIQAGKGVFSNVGCVILDEGTSMSESDLTTVIKANVKKDATKDPDVATWPDYNAEQNRFSKMWNILLGAPCHVIMVGHQRTDKKAGIEYTDISFQPKLAAIVKRDMHLVGHVTADIQATTGVDEPKFIRQIQVHPTKFISAKTRISGLPVKMDVDKIVPVIVEYIDGDRADENPKEELPVELVQVTANEEPDESSMFVEVN